MSLLEQAMKQKEEVEQEKSRLDLCKSHAFTKMGKLKVLVAEMDK